MELKNKIDWQVKNLQECGLSITASGRNEFHVINADVEHFAYYWTKKEPKTFENTSKTDKKYFVLAWKFDNVSKWVSIPTFKKIMVEDWYLIALERKFTSAELIKELDIAAQGYDDFEPFIMKDDIYIKSVAKHNRDVTKLSDAIAKNNTDLIDEEKEEILIANKAKRKEVKIKHQEKMQRLQEDIKNIRKEELIKKINDLQNIAIEKLNSEEIVNHLENEDNLSITEIETYIDRIIDQHFEKPFLTNTLIIYLIKGISLIATTRTLTLNERNLKVDKYLLDQYNEVGEDVSVAEVKKAIKEAYVVDKKLNLNNVLELLNSAGLTNKDILKTIKYIACDESFEDAKTYNNSNELASDICKVYNIASK